MNSFLIALQFITILPIKKELNYSEENIGKSMVFYPLIGTIIGLVLFLVNVIGSMFFPNMVRSSLVLIVYVFLTGGLHIDGLADSFDGIFGGKDKKDIINIMGDTKIGSYGVISLVLIMILKFSLIHEISINTLNYILIFVPTVSRWCMILSVYLFPYAKKEGFGKAFKLYFDKRHLIISTFWTFIVALFLFKIKGLIILISSVFITILLARFISKKIEGLTGDNYGAINEIMEVVILLLFIF